MISSKSVGAGLVALAVVVAFALVLAGVWFAGRHSGIQAQLLNDAKARDALVVKARRNVEAEQRRGQSAVRELQGQLAAQRELNESLNRRLADVPRFVASRGCPSPAAAQLSRAGVVRLNTALGDPGLPAGTGGDVGPAAGAGAAGAASAAQPAAEWFEPSGVTVDEAQRNAEDNFRRCTEIRTRCLGLIEFIKSRPSNGLLPQEIAP